MSIKFYISTNVFRKMKEVSTTFVGRIKICFYIPLPQSTAHKRSDCYFKKLKTIIIF